MRFSTHPHTYHFPAQIINKEHSESRAKKTAKTVLSAMKGLAGGLMFWKKGKE